MATIFRSELQLPDYPKNLATMLNANIRLYGNHPIYQEVHNDQYVPLSWNQFKVDVSTIQQNLKNRGLKKGHRVAILSPNRKEMLEIELAIMSMGAIAVPIFAGYTPKWADTLVKFCDPQFVVVANQVQYSKITFSESYKAIIHFEPLVQENSTCFVEYNELLNPADTPTEIKGEEISFDTVCLMMFTSGTMGKPKCVQLTHGNILSQQAAMRTLWKLSNKDRFLSYLPWHHSFGGIFEKYAAITNGATLALEHSFGKQINIILENWKKVRPTVFFSVPRIYQEIATLIKQDRQIENLIFHDELRFVFTAAAPLPKNISDMFLERNIPVIEGWGLTETSPCCTVTDPNDPRLSGVVGKPIPGVDIKLADDGEILVNGPNVMQGYFNDPEATNQVLSDEGWFATGDIGEFTSAGLRLITRKDRIFKLSNAKKVIPTEIENLVVKDCAYLAHAYVSGKNHDYPVALLFPNKNLFSNSLSESYQKIGCDCPGNIAELANCLKTCLIKCNEMMDFKYYRIKSAMLIDYEPSIEREELTPSMKLAPNVIGDVFEANIEYLYDTNKPLPEKVYVIHLD